MKKIKMQLLSILLAIVMVVGFMPLNTVSYAYSEGDIPGTTGSGSSESDPVVCDTFSEFKSAMENSEVGFVKINGINQNDDTIPAFDTISAAIVQETNKVLIIEGTNTIWAALNGNCDCLIWHRNGSLTVKGNGTLEYKHGMTGCHGAVIYQSYGPLTIESGVTLKGSANGDTFGRALSISGGTTVIYGGTFIGYKANQTIELTDAVDVYGGSLTVYGGSFFSNYYKDPTQVSDMLYGLGVDDGTVNLIGGTYNGIDNSSSPRLSDLLSSGCSYITNTGNEFDGTSIRKTQEILTVVINKYTVAFDVNGHGTAPSSQTVEAGQTATMPTDPSETGWEFGGWYTDAACTTAFDFATPINSDITLHAKWTENAVTYNINVTNGTASPSSAQAGETVTITTDLTNDKVFLYWRIDYGTFTLTDAYATTTTFVMPAEDVSVTACCNTIPIQTDYTVTFDVNGHGSAPSSQTVEAGQTATMPTDPSETGWEFGGWYTDAACTTAFDFATPINSDITLYAKWTENAVVPTNYTVTFDVNGHGSAPSSQTIEAGQTANMPTDPSETGWAFGGWYTDAACTTAFDFATPINSDITLYAKWTENTVVPTNFTVTFESNGGSAVASQTVADGGSASKPADPTKDGFAFDGWYQDATFTVAFDFNTVITADITLYAKWTENAVVPTNYTVTFESNGGSAVASQTVADGNSASKPADPTKDGFAFDGWYQDATFTVAFDFNTVITADITLYAKWTEISSDTPTPTPTADTPTPTPVSGTVTYTVVSGGDGTWTMGSNTNYVITVKRSVDDDTCFAHFTGVQIDGVALVAGTDYYAASGSTIVTINASTLETLGVGTHTVTVLFDDGQISTTLTFEAANATPTPTIVPTVTPTPTPNGAIPATGEEVSTAVYIGVAMICASVVVIATALVIRRKKERYQ